MMMMMTTTMNRRPYSKRSKGSNMAAVLLTVATLTLFSMMMENGNQITVSAFQTCSNTKRSINSINRINPKQQQSLPVLFQSPSKETGETPAERTSFSFLFQPQKKQKQNPIRQLRQYRPFVFLQQKWNQISQHLNQVGRRFQRKALALLVATTLFFNAGAPLPAHAAAAAPPETPTGVSLRPGMTFEQAQAADRGEVTAEDLATASSSATATTVPNAKQQKQKQQQQKVKDFDDDEDDYLDDDFDLDEDQVVNAPRAGVFGGADGSGTGTTSASPPPLSSTTGNFASYHERSAAQQRATNIKVGLLVFGPTFGGTLIREYVRRRREEQYVMKGLEIQKAQFAEYFNVTADTEDSDLEDALKNIKNNETDTDGDSEDDDDDEDSDDDDDDDDDGPSGSSSPKRPKRPSPGGGGGDGSSGSGGAGGGDSTGDGRPSEEDLDRLNQMFKRS